MRKRRTRGSRLYQCNGPRHTSWQSSPLSLQLAEDNLRPMCPGICTGIQARVARRASTALYPYHPGRRHLPSSQPRWRPFLQKEQCTGWRSQERASILEFLCVVPKKGGKFRPVINLRPLNRFQHFKMEGMHVVKDLLQKGTG